MGRYLARPALLATASDDHTVKVWDAATGKEKFTLAGHASEVIAVLFSPTTNTLVSGDRQGILKLWDLSSRRVLKSVAAHHDRIQSLAWSAGGHFLASTADDSRILVWEMPGMLFRSEHGSVGTKSASFSPDGDLLAAGSSGTINIEDVQTGGRRRHLFQPSRASQVVAILAGRPADCILRQRWLIAIVGSPRAPRMVGRPNSTSGVKDAEASSCGPLVRRLFPRWNSTRHIEPRWRR